MNDMNGRQKITVSTLAVALTLIGTIFAAAWALDSRYATNDDVEHGFNSVLKAINDLNCASIRSELNDIETKEQTDELTVYDKSRRSDLELRWQRECLESNN